MAASFVAQREVFITRAPVPMFPFHAIALWKIEEGIDKLFLHVWNDVSSTVINLNAIKFLSEGTKGIQSTCRWLAIFTEYLFRSLVSNDSVYILLIPLKLLDWWRSRDPTRDLHGQNYGLKVNFRTESIVSAQSAVFLRRYDQLIF